LVIQTNNPLYQKNASGSSKEKTNGIWEPLKIAFVTRTSEIFVSEAEVKNRRRRSFNYVEDDFWPITMLTEIAAVRSKNEFQEVPLSGMGYGTIAIKPLGRLWIWLFAGDYRLLFHGKQRLRFDDGALLGKSVESMNMQLAVMSFVIDQAERNQIGSGPLRIRHKNATLLGHLYQFAMRLTI
jgi:hypothetical protein